MRPDAHALATTAELGSSRRGDFPHKPLEVWIERASISRHHLLERPPPSAAKFDLVDGQLHAAGSSKDEPETDIGVALVGSNGGRDRDKGRIVAAVDDGGFDSQLLASFAASRRGRMFIRFDVTAGRQEQSGFQVVDEQHVAVVGIEKHGV